MLLRITTSIPNTSSHSLLSALNQQDVVLCSGDGVYAMEAIQAAHPELTVYAFMPDCAARGLNVTPTITSDTLSQLQQQHQQWITI
ncbi:DsrH/TusB family sulfur metabolism protein [Alteromonas lipolytica]|uniref:Uncharacterized protein n=1 Tax=Alteromonas lipolytica TaxID=1856405 RepID=A0A1E8FI02_9ALTE|nr:DsrH/TusB family sulfur metabolism protein [Alteromonas lipolytica]OFI35248.1 hypothetical protein BFC17_17080 [Alteromonas lipolytica]GGF57975.1 hypothetical protein GCM10011338_07780 [Alteromonas lipolytica]